MKWMLVYIIISGGEVTSLQVNEPYENMTECFQAREELAVLVGGPESGFYPINMQGICVRTE